MQDQTLQQLHGLEMSRQPPVHSCRSPLSHSDDDLPVDESPLHSGSQLPFHLQISENRPMSDNPGTSGSPPMSAGPLISDNPQIHNHQQMPNDPPTPEFGPRHGYPATHGYPPAHSYCPAHCYPPTYGCLPTHGRPHASNLPPIPGYPLPHGHPYMEPDRHPSTEHQAYSSVSLPRPSAPGMAGREPRPNAELSNLPIPQGPPSKYQGIDICHSMPAQAPTNNPVQPHFPLTDNADHGKADKDIQSPNMKTPATPPTSNIIPPSCPLLTLPPSLPMMPPADDPEREIIIAVMGPTGAGKSYFIKEVSGIQVSDVKVGSNHSYTSEVQSYSFPYAGATITLVDTPGFSNTTKSDTEVLADICTWTSLGYKEKRLLSGIVYLHRITDVCLDGPTQKTLGMFERFCGPSALQNVLLTTTQWSNIDPMLGWQREEDLRRQDFWGGLISKGASLERFTGARESGLELIYKLMKREPKPLCIQDQIVEKGMALVETDAGKFINDELISLQKKYEKDLRTLERERQNAVTEKDDEMEKILAQVQAKAQGRLEKAAAERKLLAGLSEAEMRKREEAERKRTEEREKNDKAVIAVALNDISIMVRAVGVPAPYSTKGRLIYDIDDPGEFEKAPFDITISYQRNTSFIDVWAKTLAVFTDGGVDTNDYIVHNKTSYRPKPGGPIARGTQKFHIFTKNIP